MTGAPIPADERRERAHLPRRYASPNELPDEVDFGEQAAGRGLVVL